MKKFQVELDEIVCQWLEHIAEVTGQSIEDVIANGISCHVAKLEAITDVMFSFQE